jgi:hypothetical protein
VEDDDFATIQHVSFGLGAFFGAACLANLWLGWHRPDEIVARWTEADWSSFSKVEGGYALFCAVFGRAIAWGNKPNPNLRPVAQGEVPEGDDVVRTDRGRAIFVGSIIAIIAGVFYLMWRDEVRERGNAAASRVMLIPAIFAAIMCLGFVVMAINGSRRARVREVRIAHGELPPDEPRRKAERRPPRRPLRWDAGAVARVTAIIAATCVGAWWIFAASDGRVDGGDTTLGWFLVFLGGMFASLHAALRARLERWHRGTHPARPPGGTTAP